MTWKRGITLDLLSAKCETIIFDHDIAWVDGGHLGFDLAVTLAHHKFPGLRRSYKYYIEIPIYQDLRSLLTGLIAGPSRCASATKSVGGAYRLLSVSNLGAHVPRILFWSGYLFNASGRTDRVHIIVF